MNSALSDEAFGHLCWLLEGDSLFLSPEAGWIGEPEIYRHLLDLQALSVSHELAVELVCPSCYSGRLQPQLNPYAGRQSSEDDHADFNPDLNTMPYRGYCYDCGWIGLQPEQALNWQVEPPKIAQWLGQALGLTPRYRPEPVIDGLLWRLGETEFRRKRHTLFFGRRLLEVADDARARINKLAAPGAEIVLTTSDPDDLRSTALADRVIVPLRAVAHLRKAGLVVENLEAYLAEAPAGENSRETSLRFLHSSQFVLIDGEKHPLSPQVYIFLCVLEEADGDEVLKSKLAEAMGVDTFRRADVFKRHQDVFDTFIGADDKGYYWLKPEFVDPAKRKSTRIG